MRGAVTNPAEVALLPEFGTLSKLTGNPVYYDTAKRADDRAVEAPVVDWTW